MRFTAVFATLAALLAPAILAAPPTLKSVERYTGTKTGSHIVRLKPGVSRKQFIRKLKLPSNTVDWDLINGFSAALDDETLNVLRASDEVEALSEDGLVHTMATISQTDAPWGLQRITQAKRLSNSVATSLNFNYTYDESAGTGVDIYIADTGIHISHTDFGGRARWGGTFGTVGTVDDNGHGTHCAGTAAGGRYGVAKNATLIAVKVLSSIGYGTITGIVSGLDWIKGEVAASGRPSVVSMSLGGEASTALDSAVAGLVSAGIHVVVAAGNEFSDALFTSPAREPTVITVGATNIQDQRPSFSNHGHLVDIFAPGQDVISTWIGSNNTATKSMTGTSMATPHVAGLVAYLIAKDGNASPAELSEKVKALSVKGTLGNIPYTTNNTLAQIGPVA
ncbi:serine protease [Coprinopsis sp. MPI-PUGE-AT-0042]|nr:serine protease [Coprinopsis sp. MPI-PUGE-AT-0042]